MKRCMKYRRSLPKGSLKTINFLCIFFFQTFSSQTVIAVLNWGSEIVVVLLYLALWLVKKTRATVSTNQIQT